MSFLSELSAFLRVRKRYWLTPFIVVMVLIIALLILTGGSTIGPFIHYFDF